MSKDAKKQLAKIQNREKIKMQCVKIGVCHYWILNKDMDFINEHIHESPSASVFVNGGLERCMIRMIREINIVNKPKSVSVNINDEKIAKITAKLPKIVENVKIAIPEKEMQELSKVSHKVVSDIEFMRFAEKRALLNKSILDYKQSRVNYYTQKALINAMPLKAEMNRLDTKITQLNKPVERIALGRKYSADELDQLKYFYEETRKFLIMQVSKQSALIEIALEDDPDYVFQSDLLKALEIEKKQSRGKVTNHLKWFSQYRNTNNGKAIKSASVESKTGKIAMCCLSFRVSETKVRGY
jgi:hypothetical protein